ncbi:MAG: SDR family NAD(P)-dependent oxidoreductase [Candidatus Thiodiazotropha sp. (ex Monitilora ramsayi)]|nr:SDR family NAD(P)-dependent oxidoreductase [Candidatus Thiodiazotropha sp. (ex Monitilora ramsayi)]
MTQSYWDTDDIADQTDRQVVITGATSGIGREAARILAGKNASVTIGARNLQKAEDVVDKIRNEFPSADLSVRELDLSNLASVARFAGSIISDFNRLDVLINNAGIMMCPHSKTEDGFEIQMGTNHLGHFALTGHLLPLLQKTAGARIVVLSSLAHKMGNIDFNDLNWEQRKYNTNTAYGDSKLANLLFAYELARKLEQFDNNPLVTAAHPGWTGTDLQRHSGLISFLNRFFAQGVDMGALPTLRAGFDSEAQSGSFYGPSRFFEMHGNPIKVKSNGRSHDQQAARELWQQSEKLTGVIY